MQTLPTLLHHTCVPYSPQTTDQHSPWWVSQATSLSTSPLSLTPIKRAAASVEHTVFPQSAASNSSNGCTVEYTILNLMRCVSYQSTATALLGSQRGKPVIVGDTVMHAKWVIATDQLASLKEGLAGCREGAFTTQQPKRLIMYFYMGKVSSTCILSWWPFS